MDFPGRLVDQIAAEAGCSAHQVKLALYLKAQAAQGKTLLQCCTSMQLSREYLMIIARAWIIDFSDYRPFARLDERPEPIGKLT